MSDKKNQNRKRRRLYVATTKQSLERCVDRGADANDTDAEGGRPDLQHACPSSISIAKALHLQCFGNCCYLRSLPSHFQRPDPHLVVVDFSAALQIGISDEISG